MNERARRRSKRAAGVGAVSAELQEEAARLTPDRNESYRLVHEALSDELQAESVQPIDRERLTAHMRAGAARSGLDPDPEGDS